MENNFSGWIGSGLDMMMDADWIRGTDWTMEWKQTNKIKLKILRCIEYRTFLNVMYKMFFIIYC